MKRSEEIIRPSKAEQKVATSSYKALEATLKLLKTDNPEIEIEETKERIVIPINALKLLAQILKKLSQGQPVSIVPVATEMTTQAAAEVLSCSRPHIVKLLEEGKIPYVKVGKHRRVKFEDVLKFKETAKLEQKKRIIQIMKTDEETGLYDT